jgi:predicted DNA-binding protein (MmcQ/YjbR family)
MYIVEIRAYCLSKPHTEECLPFDETTLVFKVMGKMFALLSLDEPEHPALNLKCDPELAIELREKHPCVAPGYHMNKKLWNSITVDGSVSDKLIKEWIDHSYHEVVIKLPKKLQLEISINP